MAVTYSYDPPVGGATEIQVVFEYNNHYQSRSIESVFADGSMMRLQLKQPSLLLQQLY